MSAGGGREHAGGPRAPGDDGQSGARRVTVLPDDLANQIAAGEVVERPASVVKELVENALDAGARRIRIDVEGGGVALVRVADDGGGMGREDASLAVLRHATSKIGRIEDLREIRSFGFRGEALPSIASVSRFSLRSRREAEAEGTEIRIEGGGPARVLPCGCAAGTVVEVRDLFYNVPARRKFLRAIATESAHVTEVAQAIALGEPSVTLVLSREGRVVREWLRAAGRAERVRAALEGEELATCAGARGPLRVEALVSRPERARSGTGWLWIFVNGRHVRDRHLARSIALAYGSVLEPGRYPVGAVFLDLPHELVDVNVHPQKAEVRFADGRAVADALYKVVAAQVAAAFGLPAPVPGNRWPGRKQRPADEPAPPGGDGWIWSTGGSGGAPPASGPAGGEEEGLPGEVPAGAEARAAPEERAAFGGPAAGEGFGGRSAGEGFGGPAAGEGFGGRSAGEPAADPWGLGGDVVPPAARPAGAGAGRRDAQGGGEAGRESNLVLLPVTLPPGFHPAAGSPPAAGPPPTAYPTAGQILTAAAERPMAFGGLRFVAQVRNTFLICEGADGMYFLDQHAAAERVTFHRLRAGFDGRAVATQKLLFPVVLQATPSEVALVEEAQEPIARAGLDLRPAGPAQLAIHAVPHILTRAAPERLARDLLDELSRSGERAFSGAVDLALATMACHGSIRAGDPVAPEEARALLAALDEVSFAGHCPHGRPVVMRIGWPELEHRVGRR